MKFKKGDKVKCIDNPDDTSLQDNGGLGAGWKLNKKLTIRDFSMDDTIAWFKEPNTEGVYVTALTFQSWKDRLQ